MSGIKDYSTTPADNDAAPPNGFPEGMAPASLNDSMRQVMADIRSWFIDPAWIDFGDTPTYSSGTVFLVTGNLTSRYSVGARIRATGTTPFTIYGTIASSSYGAPNTTVTVTWDSGSMNATLTGVAVNMFSKAGVFNSSALDALAFQSQNLSIAVNWNEGATIPSATTTDIGAATGNFVTVSGTTEIEGFGTVQAGTFRIVRFSGILNLKYNGSQLVLPGLADITTANADLAGFISEGAGVWRCVFYTRVNGQNVTTDGSYFTGIRSMTVGANTATTSGTSIDITGIPATARQITVNFVGVSTNGTDALLLQIGDSGGIEATGYVGSSSSLTTGVTTTDYTAGFGIRATGAANLLYGSITLTLQNSSNNTWCAHGVISTAGATVTTAGGKALSATLDRIRLTTTGGANTFDAGAINITYQL